jgi:cytochrome c biogenesis protein
MAMSSARKTLDFEKEFEQTRDALGATLGVAARDADASTPSTDASADAPASPHDHTR